MYKPIILDSYWPASIITNYTYATSQLYYGWLVQPCKISHLWYLPIILFTMVSQYHKHVTNHICGTGQSCYLLWLANTTSTYDFIQMRY